MSNPALQRDDRYKWVILVAAFIAQMLAIGSTSFGFGLFVKPLGQEFGLSRADVNLGLMLLIVGMALVSPLVGRMLDRFSARWTMLGGALLFGLGAVLVAVARDLWLLALATFLPLAFGTAALGPITASTLIARWFDERRGRALGIVAISASAGGALVVPVMSMLIERWGWRHAAGGVGLAVGAICTLLALLVIRDRAPSPGATRTMSSPDQRWTVRQLLATRDFWLLVISVGLMLAMSQALLSSLVAYGTDRGFSLAQATALITAVSASSIAGKVLIGLLADVVDKRLLLVGVVLLLELFLVALLQHPGFPALFACCLVAGAAIGGVSPIWAALISARFGIASFGMVMGLTVQAQMPLLLVALRFIGQSHDRSGSYDQAFSVFAWLAPIALLAALALGRPRFQKL
ncbi:MAG: MFS transporter [Comamonas sp.]